MDKTQRLPPVICSARQLAAAIKAQASSSPSPSTHPGRRTFGKQILALFGGVAVSPRAQSGGRKKVSGGCTYHENSHGIEVSAAGVTWILQRSWFTPNTRISAHILENGIVIGIREGTLVASRVRADMDWAVQCLSSGAFQVSLHHLRTGLKASADFRLWVQGQQALLEDDTKKAKLLLDSALPPSCEIEAKDLSVAVDQQLHFAFAASVPFLVTTPHLSSTVDAIALRPLDLRTRPAFVRNEGWGSELSFRFMQDDEKAHLNLAPGVCLGVLPASTNYSIVSCGPENHIATAAVAFAKAPGACLELGRDDHSDRVEVNLDSFYFVASLDSHELSLAAQSRGSSNVTFGGTTWATDPAPTSQLLFSMRQGKVSELVAPSARLRSCIAPADAEGVYSASLVGHLDLKIAQHRGVKRGERALVIDAVGDLRPNFGTYLSFELHRSSDLLDLRAHLFNLRVDRGPLGTGHPRLVLAEPGKPARVAFEFPSQHVGEEADLVRPDCASPTAPSRATLRKSTYARPSFVAFVIPPERLPMRLRLQDLMQWEKFEPTLLPATRPYEQIAAVNGLLNTVLNFYRISWIPALRQDLYPARLAFRSTSAPDGRSPWHPLWHVRIEDEGLYGEPEQRGGSFLAAAWSPDFDRTVPGDAFQAGLKGRDRDNLVRLSHHEHFCPEPVYASHALLSSRGAWLKLEKYWPWARARATISLEKYDHIVAGGRDEKTQIQRRGFLYPFGHRAALIALTVREPKWVIRPDGARTLEAPPRTRYFIRITTPEVAFGTDPAGNPVDPEMPFRSVRLTTEQTPTLDVLEIQLPGGVGIGFPLPVPKQTSGDWAPHAFWPSVCGVPFKFPVRTTDWNGGVCDCTRELIWIEDIDPTCCDPADSVCLAPIGPGFDLQRMLHDAARDFNQRFDAGRSGFGGQRAAMGRSAARGDTDADLEWVRFGGTIAIVPCGGEPCATDVPRVAHFRGRVIEYRAAVPALKRLSPDGLDKGTFEPRDPDANGNRAELFAVLVRTHPSLRAGFDRDQSASAGFSAPNPEIRSLSRRLGPTGPESSPRRMMVAGKMRTADFDPTSFFAADANILGVIPLQKIVALISLDGSGTAPSFLEVIEQNDDAADVSSLSLDWTTTDFQPWPASSPIFVPESGETRLHLAVHGTSIGMAAGPPSLTVTGSLEKFQIRIGAEVLGDFNGFGVHFRHMQFTSENGRKPTVNVDIVRVEFLGAALKFVQELKEKIPFLGGGDDKFKLDISSQGVVITAPKIDLPQLDVGPASVSNLSIYSACTIPFQAGNPLTFTFQFAKPDSRFRIVAGVYAGGGYAALELDADGIRALAICMEFGVARPLRFGPVSGEAYCFCGFVYSSLRGSSGAPTGVTYTAFVRAGGNFTAWGFFSLSLEIYVGLNAYPGGVMQGVARCRVSTKVGFVSYSYTISYTQRFAGGGGPPALAALDRGKAPHDNDHLYPAIISFDDWVEFESAFKHHEVRQ